MSTSLAEQLKRLATPQTSIFEQGDKKKASLLFDPKEAATFERSTILDISLKGLQELIKINTKFQYFESNLFSPASLRFERAVQTHEANAKLNEQITKFCRLVSPYFLLKPAQQALEWLINRYRIHEFNKNEFIALILPYHETNIFVRCLQLVKINESADPWHWMYRAQKSNVTLAKSVVLNHCASSISFMKFICNEIIAKTEEHGIEAKVLVAEYAFYCITIMGALEHSKRISEEQISQILPSVFRGLSSNINDFASSAFMIVALLVFKTKLKERLIEKILKKIAVVTINDLQSKSCLLIVLIAQTQHLKSISFHVLLKLASQPWFLQNLKELVNTGVYLTPLVKAVCVGIVNFMQIHEDGRTQVAEFGSNLLKMVILNETDADELIRIILESYKTKGLDLKEGNKKKIDQWYCKFLKQLHSLYPNVYNQIVTLSYNNENGLNSNQKQTLELFLNSDMSDVILSKTAFSIFDKLCHYDINQRIDAILYLKTNYFKMPATDQNFLKPQLVHRFNEDHSAIIDVLLEFPIQSLIQLLGPELYPKLTNILSTIQSPNTKERILEILCSGRIQIENETHLFVTILPFLFPQNKIDMNIISKILLSQFGKKHPLLRDLKLQKNPVEFCNIAWEYLFKPSDIEILKILDVINLSDKKNNFQISLALLYMNANIPKNCSAEIMCKILELLSSLSAKSISGGVNVLTYIESARNNILPMPIIILCVETLLDQFTFNIDHKLYDLTINSELTPLIPIFEMFICGKLIKKGSKKILLKFLHKISPNLQNQITILCNFLSIDDQFQINILSIINDLITDNSDTLDWLSDPILISLLSLLMSPNSEIRKKTLDVLNTIYMKIGNTKNSYAFLLKSLLNRQNEISIDHEQLPMILYTFLSTDLSVQKSLSSTEKQNSKTTLNHLVTLSVDQNYPICVTSSLFKMLSLINSKDVLNRTSVVAHRLISHATEIQIFNDNESEIILNTISKMNANTLENVSDDSNVWRLIIVMFEKYQVKLLNANTRQAYCLEVLLDTFDKDIFESLSELGQGLFIHFVINVGTGLDISEIRSSIAKFFKHIELNAQYLKLIFEQMLAVTVSNVMNKRRRVSNIPKLETLDAIEWKRGVMALEILQNKKKLHNVQVLIPLLFDILKKCLDFEEQASLEYPKQLILACILNCCQKLSPNAVKWTDITVLPETAFNIELIVQCIRATQNPQTHHHALLLLSHISGMFPEQVLHHIVAIFTFMGTSVLRHDDAYSFQIITKIIDIIIPILVHKSDDSDNSLNERIIPILRVFVDVLVDVPVHRRIPLFEKLLTTFEAKNSLWLFLALVFESHVLHAGDKQTPQTTKHSLITEELPKRLEIANLIISQFEPHVILFSCIQLIEYLKNLSIDNEKFKTVDKVFGIEKRTPKQFRHFKYTVVTSVSNILASTSLIRDIALLSDEKAQNLEPLYRKLIISILSYIHSVSKCADANNGKPQGKYWKVMLHHCFDILDNINSLLCSDMFLLVIRGLMSHNLPTVRRKAMELLNTKLQSQNDLISETSDNTNVFNLIDPLVSVIETIGQTAGDIEDELNQQTALYSLKLLAKKLATNNPDKFRPILDKVVALLRIKTLQGNVLASLILCFAELCHSLRVHSLYSLNTFMPAILKILSVQKNKNTPDLVLISTVTALQKILDTLPLFLNPFLEKIITETSILCAKWCIEDGNSKNEPLVTKLKSIVQKIAQTIPHRILVPSIAQSYGKLIILDQLPAIAFVTDILSESIKVLQGSNLKAIQTELSDFFLSALQFRSDNAADSGLDQNQISLVEGHTVKALVSLVLKLSESSFKPLYFKIYEWATRDEEQKDRTITFYRVSRDVADSLKGLFVLFAGSFLKNAAGLLEKCNNFNSETLYFDDEEKCCVLMNYILETLNFVFLYDNQNFINKDRFEILMQPIVDQLENTVGGEGQLKYRIDNILVKCIAQFAVAIADDSLWKQLNYQVLLKTRHNLPVVRLAGLQTLCEMAKKLGEDFLPLLPETIPFLSELLEDEDEAVEAACKRAVQELETVLGEPLQKYF